MLNRCQYLAVCGDSGQCFCHWKSSIHWNRLEGLHAGGEGCRQWDHGLLSTEGWHWAFSVPCRIHLVLRWPVQINQRRHQHKIRYQRGKINMIFFNPFTHLYGFKMKIMQFVKLTPSCPIFSGRRYFRSSWSCWFGASSSQRPCGIVLCYIFAI